MANRTTFTRVSATGNLQSIVTKYNSNLDVLETELENTLSRVDGMLPNSMNGVLDMNSNKVVNVVAGTNPTDAATYGQIQDQAGAIENLQLKTATGWRDNIIPLYVNQSAQNAPALTPFRGGINAHTFLKNELTEAHSSWHVDHDYAMGTPMYPHVHWSTTSSDIGTVRWGFEYSIAKGHQQSVFPKPITIYVEQTTTGIPYMHYVAEVSNPNAISGDNIEPDTLVLVRIFRDGAHQNDTLNQDVFLMCMDLHYLANQNATPNKSPNFFQ